MATLTCWICQNCGSTYVVKPKQCVNADAIHRYTRDRFGCERYPMKECIKKDIVKIAMSHDDLGLVVMMMLADGKRDQVYFSGDGAFERQEAFCKATGLPYH